MVAVDSRATGGVFSTFCDSSKIRSSARIRCSAHSWIDQASGDGLNVHCSFVNPAMLETNDVSDDFNKDNRYVRSTLVTPPSEEVPTIVDSAPKRASSVKKMTRIIR